MAGQPTTPDEFLDSNPASPGSVESSSEASTPLDPPSSNSDASPMLGPDAFAAATGAPRRVPSLRTVSDSPALHMSSISSVPGLLNMARRPAPVASNLPMDIMLKARALQQQRMGMAGRPQLSTQSSASGPTHNSPTSGTASPTAGGPLTTGSSLMGGLPSNFRLPPGMAPNPGARPLPPNFPRSAPVVPRAGMKPPSLSERRAMKLGGLAGPGGSPTTMTATPRLSDMNGGQDASKPAINGEGRGSNLSDFKNYIDAEKGWVTFEGAATITRQGVNFANGATFSISLDEVDVLDELGKGNYGTVFKVRHSRPRAPRFGQGLSGFSKSISRQSSLSESDATPSDDGLSLSRSSTGSAPATTGVIMAMKEVRLELDEAKFTTILKELVILHECVSPYIIDFYGAFFQEGAVYLCLEYMDGGSIDKLYVGGIPEPVLRKITYASIMGLKTLKEDHNIIHRDVKPTNILVNSRGQVKICDFGVSGNLVASIAKTNIGCQSYMAPERISSGGMSAAGGMASGTYSVQSDIWSLGLTIIECAMGRYPYPPEVSSTIFSQLSAIVEGEPPELPDGFSQTARDFVKSCLNKIPAKRSTYPMLLQHPWMKSLKQPETITEDPEAEEAAAQGGTDALVDAAGKLDLNAVPGGDREVAAWVKNVLDRKNKGLLKADDGKPALHAAPLDSVSPAGSPMVPA